MSTRMRFWLLRSLPWLMGLAIGFALLNLQHAGESRDDYEVLLQMQRTIPRGYTGTLAARAFVYANPSSGDPELLKTSARLTLEPASGAKVQATLRSASCGGSEGALQIAEPLADGQHRVRLDVEVGEETFVVHGTFAIESEVSLPTVRRDIKQRLTPTRCSPEQMKTGMATCHGDERLFTPRFGGCVAGRPCRNSEEEMKHWSESEWASSDEYTRLPRYAVAVESWHVSGKPGESEAAAAVTLISSDPIVVDRFSDGVWDQADSMPSGGVLKVRSVVKHRYQFRPDPFDVEAATTFIFDPNEAAPSDPMLASEEAQIAQMPPLWSWRSQQSELRTKDVDRAEALLMDVVDVSALGAVLLLFMRWLRTRPKRGRLTEDEVRMLSGRVTTLVAGVFALILLFYVVRGIYSIRHLFSI